MTFRCGDICVYMNFCLDCQLGEFDVFIIARPLDIIIVYI